MNGRWVRAKGFLQFFPLYRSAGRQRVKLGLGQRHHATSARMSA